MRSPSFGKYSDWIKEAAVRTYLENFFREFSYEPADAGVLLAAYDQVQGNVQAKALWKEALEMYDREICCDYPRLLELADGAADATELHEYTLELLLYICMSRKLEQRYAEAGLDRELFVGAMLDLRYKLEECKAVYGIVGSFVASWFGGFYRLTRFALGRLQFEIIDFDRIYEKDGNRLEPGSKVINMHIPRTGGPLDSAGCDESFRMAKEFFRGQVADPAPFVCHSWLLYPENKNILSEQSNTYRFMSRFDIFSSSRDKNGANLWRLFDTKETHPDRLPVDTSFRRRYVEYLKKGGKLGSGYGVFFL